MTYQVRRDYRQIPLSLSVPFVATTAPVFHYVDTSVVSIGVSPQTFSSLDFGTAASTRRVIVGVASSDVTGAVASMTIGGVTATFLMAETDKIHGFLELWIANVPTGVTGDIVVTSLDIVGNDISVSWWVAYTNTDTPSFLDGTSDSGASPVLPISAVSIPDNGFSVAISLESGDITGVSASIDQSFVEQEESAMTLGVISVSQREVVGAVSGLTVIQSWTADTAGRGYFIIASWAKA